MTQVRRFQITTMAFEIAKHFINPHAASIRAACRARVRQVSGQQPRLALALGPVGQQAGRIAPLLRQAPVRPPDPLPRMRYQLAERLPVPTASTAHVMTTLLPQDIAPAPAAQLTDDCNAAKL